MILELNNITHSFSEKKQIFWNLYLSFEEKQIYVLMGNNGAGKTTLFNIITGFIKTNSGKILYKGENLSGMPPYRINQKGIARTFQDLRIITKLSVRENIILAMKDNPTDSLINALIPIKSYRDKKSLIESEVDEIIEQYHLSTVSNAFAGEISYGQQKLLTLACCVANDASLLLLDEPVAGIQPEYRNTVSMLIQKLKEQGKTIFIIEHNSDFIANIADKIFFLLDGKISTFDNLESLKNNQQVIEAYV